MICTKYAPDESVLNEVARLTIPNEIEGDAKQRAEAVEALVFQAFTEIAEMMSPLSGPEIILVAKLLASGFDAVHVMHALAGLRGNELAIVDFDQFHDDPSASYLPHGSLGSTLCLYYRVLEQAMSFHNTNVGALGRMPHFPVICPKRVSIAIHNATSGGNVSPSLADSPKYEPSRENTMNSPAPH